MLIEEELEIFESYTEKLAKDHKDFYDKLLTILKSPTLSTYLGMKIQLLAYCIELQETPFTIRGNDDFFGLSNIENGDRIIEAMTAASRQRAETSLKIARELKSLEEDVDALWKKLTKKEQKVAEKIVAGKAEELRNQLLEKNNAKKK